MRRFERKRDCFIDLTTGDFRITELANEMEVTMNWLVCSRRRFSSAKSKPLVFRRSPASCHATAILFSSTRRISFCAITGAVADGFGCEAMPAAIRAAGAILHYLKHELRRPLNHVCRLICYRNSQFMTVDAATQANLELVISRGRAGNLPGSKADTSLLGALDRTITPMGARKLRDWILHPLCEIGPLEQRQQVITDFLASPFLLGQLRETLKSIRDIERTVGRLTQIGGNARDLAVLRTSLEQIPRLQVDIAEADRAAPGQSAIEIDLRNAAEHSLIGEIAAQLHPLPSLLSLLHEAIVDEPPGFTKDGGMFRDGYYAPLDELRRAGREGKDWIAQLQQRETEATGIKSLKVRFTSVFGYFIEITKSNLHLVPATWQRKQTIVSGERYTTPELKRGWKRGFWAQRNARALEQTLFVQIRDEVLANWSGCRKPALPSPRLMRSLGWRKRRGFGYCRPTLTSDLRIEIADGRHPVPDQCLVEEKPAE